MAGRRWQERELAEPGYGPLRDGLRRNGLWLILVVPLAVGLALGYGIAYREGETGNAFYTIGSKVVVAGLGVILVLIGAVAFSGRRRRIGGLAFGSASSLLVGTFLAATLTNPLGLGYRPPVVQSARGVASLSLDGVAGFVPNDSADVTCDSIPDSAATGSVQALELGELTSATLRGTLSIDPAALTATVELFIDGGDLAEGDPQPSWAGSSELRDLSADVGSGVAEFTNLPYSDPDTQKGGSPPTDNRWPASLSGTLRWDCRQ